MWVCCARLNRAFHCAGSRVLILGAGGAARAVAFALAQAGAAISIWARRPAKGKSLARALAVKRLRGTRAKGVFRCHR